MDSENGGHGFEQCIMESLDNKFLLQISLAFKLPLALLTLAPSGFNIICSAPPKNPYNCFQNRPMQFVVFLGVFQWM